jgi:hypothetical protein
MTYRTNDTDNSAARTFAGTTAPVRHLRRRRRALALAHYSHGSSVSGFGI